MKFKFQSLLWEIYLPNFYSNLTIIGWVKNKTNYLTNLGKFELGSVEIKIVEFRVFKYLLSVNGHSKIINDLRKLEQTNPPIKL